MKVYEFWLKRRQPAIELIVPTGWNPWLLGLELDAGQRKQ